MQDYIYPLEPTSKNNQTDGSNMGTNDVVSPPKEEFYETPMFAVVVVLSVIICMTFAFLLWSCYKNTREEIKEAEGNYNHIIPSREK